jgi:hypothetical protein
MFGKPMKLEVLTNVRLESRNLKSFRSSLKIRIVTNMLVGLKIPNMRSHLMIRIGNGIIMIHQCRFHRIGHIIVHHGGSYHDMSYFYSPWTSGMSSSPIYFYPVLIPHGGLSSSRSSPTHNGQCYSKDRSYG